MELAVQLRLACLGRRLLSSSTPSTSNTTKAKAAFWLRGHDPARLSSRSWQTTLRAWVIETLAGATTVRACRSVRLALTRDATGTWGGRWLALRLDSQPYQQRHGVNHAKPYSIFDQPSQMYRHPIPVFLRSLEADQD